MLDLLFGSVVFVSFVHRFLGIAICNYYFDSTRPSLEGWLLVKATKFQLRRWKRMLIWLLCMILQCPKSLVLGKKKGGNNENGL